MAETFREGDRVTGKRGNGTVTRIVRELDGRPTSVLMVEFDGDPGELVCSVEQLQSAALSPTEADHG